MQRVRRAKEGNGISVPGKEAADCYFDAFLDREKLSEEYIVEAVHRLRRSRAAPAGENGCHATGIKEKWVVLKYNS